MSRMTVLVLAVLGSLHLPGQAFAQLTPPAGSAGAGNSHCERDGHTPVLAHRLSALRYWIGARQMTEAGVERRLY